MLKYRLISGILILAVVVLVAYVLPTPAGWFLLLGLAFLAQHEFYGMMEAMQIRVFRNLGLLGGAAVISATYWTIGPEASQQALSYHVENLVLTAIVLAVFLRQLFEKGNPQPVLTIACTLLGVFYGAVLVNYMTRLAFSWHGDGRMQAVGPTGRIMIFYLVAVVKASDVGAYFTGRLIGRHKMSPRLSPNKTWEGVGGGVLFSLVISLVFLFVTGGKLGVLPFGTLDAVLLGLVLPITGILGDLFESLLKRASGVKDSGTLVPGMGGGLDVLDSLLFGGPVLYAYAVFCL